MRECRPYDIFVLARVALEAAIRNEADIIELLPSSAVAMSALPDEPTSSAGLAMSVECHEAEVKQTQSTLGGINLGESDSSTTVQCPRGAAVALNTTYPLHGLPAARSIIMERKSLSAPYYYCSDFGTFNINCRPPCGLRFVISFF